MKPLRGALTVHGPKAHLFYDGPLANHNFKDFELKVQIMTFPQANSGLYIHTEFLEKAWPAKGYEIQVNNSQSDWRRTASLYNIVDVAEVNTPDNEWFELHRPFQIACFLWMNLGTGQLNFFGSTCE